MKVKEDLRVCSMLTIASIDDEISILESHSDLYFDWVIYIMASPSQSPYHGKARSKYLNSGLLEVLLKNYGKVFDLEGRGYVDECLQLKNVVVPSYSLLGDCKVMLESGHATEGFYEIEDASSGLATPFTSVGTKFPENITADSMCSAIMLCKNPATTNVFVSGDLEAAKSILGSGLEKIRPLYINYLGIIPGDKSVPLDMPVPFVYTHLQGEAPPSAISAVIAQNGIGYKKRYHRQVKAAMELSCTLYCILEIDHGYLNYEVTGTSYKPYEWCVTTSSSRTFVPFRYPALVFLLSMASSYREAVKYHTDNDTLPTTRFTKKVELNKAFTQLGSDSPFTRISSLMDNMDANYPMYEQLPTICKSFFISLYRLTCRGVLNLPSKKEYPRRSEASRDFVDVFKRASTLITLSGYIGLSEYLVSCAVIKAGGKDLHWVAAQLKVTPYSILLRQTELPPLQVEGNLDKLKGGRLFSYESYLTRISSWSGIKVVNEWGLPVDLAEEAKRLTLHNLELLKQKLASEDLYTYIKIESIRKMCSQYSFSATDITPRTVSEDFLQKVNFDTGILNAVSLKSIEGYHRDLGHAATELVLKTVVSLLSSMCMDSYTAIDKYSDNIDRLMLFVCVKDYLEAVLDTSRV